MYLAIIMYCAIATDTTSCDVMIRKDYLFQTEAQCEKQILPVAKGLVSTGHYVKAKCFKFNRFGQVV